MFGKLLTNQKIAHKIVKPSVYKALREGLKLMTTVKYKISEGSIPSFSTVESIGRAKAKGICVVLVHFFAPWVVGEEFIGFSVALGY